jgi:hypothetical protein
MNWSKLIINIVGAALGAPALALALPPKYSVLVTAISAILVGLFQESPKK